MKTKIGAAIVLLFLMACGSSTQPKQDDQSASAGTGSKFILKASNMMYLSMQEDGSFKANQPDPTKAEVFEKVDLGAGKTGLKAANGKFVSDNRAKNSVLEASADHASDWEKFEIMALDQTKINLKTSAGKFVSADLGKGAIINANSDKASDWEAFIMESK